MIPVELRVDNLKGVVSPVSRVFPRFETTCKDRCNDMILKFQLAGVAGRGLTEKQKLTWIRVEVRVLAVVSQVERRRTRSTRHS